MGLDKISQTGIQNDMPTAVIRSKAKPKVEFQYGGRFLETGNTYISAAG